MIDKPDSITPAYGPKADNFRRARGVKKLQLLQNLLDRPTAMGEHRLGLRRSPLQRGTRNTIGGRGVRESYCENAAAPVGVSAALAAVLGRILDPPRPARPIEQVLDR